MLARIWSREIGGGGRFIQSKHFCLLFLAGARTGWGGDGEKKKKKDSTKSSMSGLKETKKFFFFLLCQNSNEKPSIKGAIYRF